MMLEGRFGIPIEKELQLIIGNESSLNVKAVINTARNLLGTYLSEQNSVYVKDLACVKIMSDIIMISLDWFSKIKQLQNRNGEVASGNSSFVAGRAGGGS